MRVVPLGAFRDKVSFAVAVGAVERGFRALGLGEATLPDPMVMELPAEQAEVHVKGAHLKGGRHVVLKVATGFYKNRARGLPSGDGLFLLLDAETGIPDVLLEEHGYLTDLRTAAAVALTLRYLAPKDAKAALLIGAGALARLTARAMIAEMPLERLTLWNRTRVPTSSSPTACSRPSGTATCGTPSPPARSRATRSMRSWETSPRAGAPGASATARSPSRT